MGPSRLGLGGYGPAIVGAERPWSTIALWATPRTVSTAFERMMIERGDHEVFDEPFSAYYYFSAHAPSSRFSETRPDCEPDQILERLEQAEQRSPVFIKDMAHHAGPLLDGDLLARFTNSFLIREPTAALASFARRWPDLTEDEAGYGRLLQAYELAADLGGPAPVIDSDDLRADPAGIVEAWCDVVGIDFDPSALSWEPGMQPQWELWPEWYGNAATSTGFLPPDTEEAHLDDPRLLAIRDRAAPIYEQLREARLRA